MATHAQTFGTWDQAVSWLLSQPEHAELCRACYYDRPPLAAAERFHASEEWAALRKLMPRREPGRDAALDVGAGMGVAAYALARDGWATTALEPDASTLVHARQVLHHARELPRFCSELFRVLRPGGRLLATREHVVSSPAQLPAFLANHALHRYYGGEHAYTLDQYLTALRGAGFIVHTVLGPLQSVINYAPFTEATLVDAIADRARRLPGGASLARVLLAPPWRRAMLAALSPLDRRPGRLFTFVADKPAA